MSVTGRPRIHFVGGFVTNVCTVNNNDPGAEDQVDDASVSVDGGGRDDAALRAWFRGIGTDGSVRGGWNVFGDNGCFFERAAIRRVDLPDGRSVTQTREDPLVGATVHLGPAVLGDAAAMVDCHPQGAWGTQIFSDEVGVRSGATTLWSGPPGRFYSRWVDFRRNLGVGGFAGGAAIWQAGIPREAMTFGPEASPGLDALREACGAQRGAAAAPEAGHHGRGVLVRFCTYLLEPRLRAPELAARFAQGGTDTNPARGIVVGTIGPWEADDACATVPSGRRLHPVAALSSPQGQYQTGPALARVDTTWRRVSLDLAATFPEVDRTLVKVDPGPVTLALEVRGEAAPRPLGPVPTDRASYESGGGVVDVPLPDGVTEHDLAAGTLVLRAGTVVALRETVHTVETDDRALYLQARETSTITLRFRTRDAPPGSAVVLPVEQYVTTGGATPALPATPADRVVAVPDRVETLADGTATVSVRGLRAGAALLRFLVPGAAPGAFGGALDSFAVVRVLPTDDFSTVPDSALSFRFVYENVLRYYWIVYPAMDRFVDLHDEQSVLAVADLLRERIAASRWSSAEYMPRTRELSAGKRALLDRWLSLAARVHIPGL